MSSRRELECQHGSLGDCPDCLRNKLAELHTVLEDPDARSLIDEQTLKTIIAWIPKVLDRITRIEEGYYMGSRPQTVFRPITVPEVSIAEDEPGRADGSVYESVDDDPEFFSPRNDNSAAASRKRFKPDVISGSAFGTKEPPANPPIEKRSVSPRQSTSSGLVLNPGQRQRKTWSQDQVADLKAGFQRFGSSWERIRKEYKSLEQFTGMQLKDKHRATFGTRASLSPQK